MYDDERIQSFIDDVEEMDHRMPVLVEPGYHATKVVTGTPEVGDAGIGFYDRLLAEDYNQLEPDQWVTLRWDSGNGTERYRLEVTGIPARTAEEILSPDQQQLFSRGGALLPGSDDERGRSYNPWHVDDRIERRVLERDSLVLTEEHVTLRSVSGREAAAWKELQEAGHPLADIKGGDHRVQYT